MQLQAQSPDWIAAGMAVIRLDLAQTQCCITVDAIGELKNPQPGAFVKKANIGKAVQVNNGTASDHTSATRAEKAENAPNELLVDTSRDARGLGIATGPRIEASCKESESASRGDFDRAKNAGDQSTR
jgi:hypothetical protein